MKEVKVNVKLNDYQTLDAARGRFGHTIPTYDDGWGGLYIVRDSMGIVGIVRAVSWEAAYEIAEDEFFPSAGEEAFEKDFDDMTDHERECWHEAYGHRPSGAGGPTPEEDKGVYAKDLNGESIDPLTFKMLDDWQITLDVSTDWDGIREDILEFLISAAHGQYVPHVFASDRCTKEMFDHQSKNVQVAIAALMDPKSNEDEWYWENWQTVLDGFQFKGYNLHQEGDLYWVDTIKFDQLAECYGVDEDEIMEEVLCF